MEIRFLILLFVAMVATVSGRASFTDDTSTEANIGTSSPPPKPTPKWWQSCTFYQVYPRSFKDSNGDGVGDIPGIIEKLPYLKDLNVCGFWLSPVFKSPMVDMGYDIENFYEVDPVFGTNNDLEKLFAEAKKLGLRVILDFVPNHSSDKSEWFKKSIKKDGKYKDYYIWADAKTDATNKRIPPNNWVCRK